MADSKGLLLRHILCVSCFILLQVPVRNKKTAEPRHPPEAEVANGKTKQCPSATGHSEDFELNEHKTKQTDIQLGACNVCTGGYQLCTVHSTSQCGVIYVQGHRTQL